MKFCNNCGRRLGEGEICQCMQNQGQYPPPQGEYQTQGMYQNQVQYQTPQGMYQNQVPYQNTTNQQNDFTAKMKWFKFVIYAQLFLTVLTFLGTGTNLFMGLTYDNYKGVVYEQFPYLEMSDKCFGLIFYGMAIWAIVIRQQLANFKKNGPFMYLAFCIVQLVILIGYGISFYFTVCVNAEVDAGTWDGVVNSLILSVVSIIIFFILNKIYFDKRKHMFIN